MKNILKFSGVILLALFIQSCKEKPTPPVLTTTAVTTISYSTATSGGEVTNEGGDPLISRGICWNTVADPTISNSKTMESGSLGTFTSNITLLTPNTTFYVRAYGTNTAGTGYGDSKTFITLQVAVPVLTTTAITAITQTSAVSGGNVTDDKGGAVSARGICWGTTTSPTTANNKTTDATGTGSFISTLTGLLPGTLYYIRSYATNSVGTAYGSEISFTTQIASVPVLTTTAITSITQNSATGGGAITSDGAASITARGVCWGTDVNPTTSNNKTTDGTDKGTFVSSLTGLLGNTTYNIRAYATNSVGTAYGNQLSFITSPVIPTISTSMITNITSTTASSGGNVTNDGGANITAKGLCWSTSAKPTITLSTKTIEGAGSGAFTNYITGLTGNTLYYIRAYATNSFGTAYGNEIIFTTLPYIIFNPNLSYGTVTDIDGNEYKTITIGSQIWMAENLRTTKYRNGDLIGTTNPATLDITTEIEPKYQWASGGSEDNVLGYGRVYTWYAAMDSRNVCPVGWHIPNDAQWTILTNYLINNAFGYGGSGSDIAKSMAVTSGWTINSTVGTPGNDQTNNNSSGFTAIPGGMRLNNYGTFFFYKSFSYWWSATEYSVSVAHERGLRSDYSDVFNNEDNKSYGFSVRCLMDN